MLVSTVASYQSNFNMTQYILLFSSLSYPETNSKETIHAKKKLKSYFFFLGFLNVRFQRERVCSAVYVGNRTSTNSNSSTPGNAND